MVTVVIVSQCRLSGEGIATLVARQDDLKVCAVATLDGAQGALEMHRPHLVVFDRISVGTAWLLLRSVAHGRRPVVIAIGASEETILTWIEEVGAIPLLADAVPDDFQRVIDSAVSDRPFLPRALSEVMFRKLHQRRANQARGLTHRQREVLELVRAGLANKQIAGSLHIAESTVKKHLHAIFGKLDVDSRMEAASHR